MAELKPCPLCGGKAEVDKMWVETAFGDRPFVGHRCSKCHARTSFSMTDISGSKDEEMLGYTERLWNRGCVGVFSGE
jgi:hypothetical protein